MNTRRIGRWTERNGIKNGIFIQIEDNSEQMIFAKDGVEISFNLNVVRFMIDNFYKAIPKKESSK